MSEGQGVEAEPDPAKKVAVALRPDAMVIARRYARDRAAARRLKAEKEKTKP